MERRGDYFEKHCVSSSIIKLNVDLMSRMTEILFLLPPHPAPYQIQHGMLLIDRIYSFDFPLTYNLRIAVTLPSLAYHSYGSIDTVSTP